LRAVHADWAKVAEIRASVARFRETGKPVYAYIDGAGTREYALACSADEIVVSPEANLMVLGISAELAFMKDTLAKLGMEADFVHVGAYKSAPERMTRNSASAANREMITSIVDERYGELVGMLATSRGVSRSQAESWIDHGMYDGGGAAAVGLADTVMYFDDIFDLHFGDDPTTDMADYVLAVPDNGSTDHKVAIVHVTGVIMPGESRVDRFQGKIAGSETVVDQLKSASEDETIDAVILRVDSPGGSALASDLIWHQIRRLQVDKPIIISMSGLAASGGYYIACPGDSIFAEPGTLTGSIGVFAGKMSRTKMYEKIALHREFITRGENALLFSDEGGFTPAQRVLFQEQMDGFYERFLAKVADGRDMTRDEVHRVAQGRVWTGQQGLDRGLVDGLGGLRRAIDSVKWTLGMAGTDKISVVTFEEPQPLLERLLVRAMRESSVMAQFAAAGQRIGVSGGPLASVSEAVLATLRQDGTLAALSLLDGQPVAMMPYQVKLN